jgi:hypothetical protein
MRERQPCGEHSCEEGGPQPGRDLEPCRVPSFVSLQSGGTAEAERWAAAKCAVITASNEINRIFPYLTVAFSVTTQRTHQFY